ncbi:MAG: 50S ribosomal protein L24 [Candidatus Caldatribacteriota bacterium]|jgi:large subunit ribosomal protein L24|nr:50S ribosomal protein L24 [Atribacterota bacterium]MDD4288492.1 50S ribosomal protein L24 [Atribacterota bacterium]MDD4764325.1 50S ribosomal protein L24 [Atribacterota bacterium]MDD5636176.1 50S ribosomal protein L24 [Atribacterota bacterium]MDI9596852.1 50S ribosomal protein L24 [Atribacterota bacterium]
MQKGKVALKKGDNVLVISGEDKGKKGKIIDIFPNKKEIIVEGVNFLKKHMKPTQKSPQGGIVKQEGPIHLSNVRLVCNKCSKPTNIKRDVTKEGSKVRVCKKCGEIIDKV